MIYWEWHKGRPTLRKSRETDPDITLQTHQCPENEVKRGAQIKYTAAPTETTRILGVYLNPIGDFTDQIRVLQKKSDRPHGTPDQLIP
jgi:hypothetical protein